MTATLAQVVALARRSVLRSVTQPANIVPAFAMPLLLLAVATAQHGDAARLPGFPADSYRDFYLAGAFVQAAMVSGINSGADLAADLESGFLDRLQLTRVGRWPLLIGQVAGAVVVAVAQVVVYLGIGLAFGTRIAAGPAAILVALPLAVLISLTFTGLAAVIAVRSRSAEVVHGLLPVFFVLLTFSSLFMPREEIDAGWFHTVATYNPMTHLIDGMRSLVVAGWDADALVVAFALAGAISAVAFALAAFSLGRGRVTA
jgi:ABC-2 type transport system permease protein